MAHSDNITALNKAYAETILNIAKEAAVRIMSSEKRARRREQDLIAVKEESMRLMLVLKRMLDQKVNESEMISRIQGKKILELEAQLGEAEDIVRDLRTELGKRHDEYERATNKIRVLKEQNLTILPDNNRIYNQLSNLTYYVDPSSCRENCGACISDFPSILTRPERTELYKNACTQRIHALHRSLFNQDLSVSDKKDGINDLSSLREENHDREKCQLSKTSPNAEAADDSKMAEQEFVDTVETSKQKNSEAVKDWICMKTCTNRVLSLSNKTEDDPSSVREESQDREKCQLSETSQNVDIAGDSKMIDQESVDTKTEKVTNLAVMKACCNQENVKLSSDKVEPPRQQDGTNADLEAANLSSVEVVPVQPVNKPVIKYTFQRKRKRELLNMAEEVDKISLKGKAEREQGLDV